MELNDNKNINKSLVNKIRQQCDLIETIDIPPNTTTYKCGTSQIDYAICSPRILTFIRFNPLHEFGTICTSNHRRFIIDLAFEKWVDTIIYIARHQRLRLMFSINPMKTATYKRFFWNT